MTEMVQQFNHNIQLKLFKTYYHGTVPLCLKAELALRQIRCSQTVHCPQPEYSTVHFSSHVARRMGTFLGKHAARPRARRQTAPTRMAGSDAEKVGLSAPSFPQP